MTSEILETATESSSASADDESVLRVDGLEKVYGSDEDPITAVDGVSFEIERGTVLGLLGPNGAGKTTLTKLILGLVLPSAGTVEFDTQDGTEHPYECASAVLEGSRNVYWKLTARENLEFFAGLQGIDSGEVADYHQELLERFGIADRADEPVQNLSRGMKQRVAIASVLARATPVVFLDEPTLGLDVEASRQLRDELPKIAAEDRTVIVSSHDMDVIQEVCDRVIILNDGRIAADDSVDNLIDVFNRRPFHLEVSPTASETTRERIETRLSVDSWEHDDGTTEFEVSLAEDEHLSELVDVLRTQDLTVEYIESVEPSLEDVFLHYTGEDDVLVTAGDSA